VATLDTAILLLDALDECSAVVQLLPGLLSLARQSTTKVIVTSRREADLNAALKSLPSLHMGVDEVKEDIRLFSEHRVAASSQLSNALVRSRVLRALNVRNNGMFLWVVLVIQELELIVSVFEVEQAIMSLPEGLEGIYERIIRRLAGTLKGSRRTVCYKLLRLLALAKRALLLSEVNEALKLDYSLELGSSVSHSLLIPTSELEIICGSLVTVRNQSIRLVHLTAHEYFQQDPCVLHLEKELHEFFVDVGKGNARITGLCVKYLSVHGDIAEKLAPETKTHGLLLSLPFLEYACQNWLLHLVGSSPLELLKYKPELERFLCSYDPFYWIDLTMRLKPGGGNTLQLMVQSLLDWLHGKWTKTGLEASQLDHLGGLLSFWGASYLGLLAEWLDVLVDAPFWIHKIDPATIFPSHDYGIREHFQRRMTFEKHAVLDEVDTFTTTRSAPHNRCLFSPASHWQQVIYIFDGRKKVVVAVEQQALRVLKLHCQDMVTGRRLEPLSDLECFDVDDILVPVSAAVSPDGQYLGVVYNWYDDGSMFYSAVWKFNDSFDFEPKASTIPWAQKVFSTTTDKLPECHGFPQIIAFDAAGYVYLPASCVNIFDGSEKTLSAFTEAGEKIQTFCFSKNGTLIAVVEEEGQVELITQDGGVETLPWEEWEVDATEIDFEFGIHLSTTERYILFNSDYIRCWIYDRRNKKGRQLFDDSVRYHFTPIFHFNLVDSLLVGACHYTDATGRETSTIYIWSVSESQIELQTTYQRDGIVAAMQLDEPDNVLHIVSDSIWSRLQLSGFKLRELDEVLNVHKYNRVEHQVSRDGTQLAVLHIGRSRCVGILSNSCVVDKRRAC
jgi:hypothetical protein